MGLAVGSAISSASELSYPCLCKGFFALQIGSNTEIRTILRSLMLVPSKAG